MLLRVLCALGQRVLLVSYTHSAVDNILLKLLPHFAALGAPAARAISAARLGRSAQVHALVRPLLAPALGDEELEEGATTLPPLASTVEWLAEKALVASTCLGARRWGRMATGRACSRMLVPLQTCS